VPARSPRGKWHLGSQNGHLPNDQGFDEWYGIPRTTDEALWHSSPGYSPSVMPPEQIMEGKKGEKSRDVRVYDIEQRRLIDAEITRRTVAFMERQTQARKPFFAYATLTQPHLPTLPNPTFAGKTGNGDWADTLAEMDANVFQMLVWCADRLQAVKWRHYKVHFYQQETMVSPPVKLPVPFLFNLYTNPQEDENKPALDTWIIGPVLKMVGAFDESVKQYPLIPMGTPDPYRPPTGSR
jgi:hypothetical protein